VATVERTESGEEVAVIGVEVPLTGVAVGEGSAVSSSKGRFSEGDGQVWG